MKSPFDITPKDGRLSPTSPPFPYPFDRLEPRFIVGIKDRHGLHEVLGEAKGGQWILRDLNGDGLPVSDVRSEDVRGFDLPIVLCFAAARDRAQIVVAVCGEEYDVTDENEVTVAAPLFQAVHSSELISFAKLALSAGFTTIELNNGYAAWEGAISQLIADCNSLASATRP